MDEMDEEATAHEEPTPVVAASPAVTPAPQPVPDDDDWDDVTVLTDEQKSQAARIAEHDALQQNHPCTPSSVPGDYAMRKIVSVKYVGNMLSGKKKIEFLSSGAMFGENGMLTPRGFELWKAGFRVTRTKDENGGAVFEVKAPSGEYSGHVFWHHCEPGDVVPPKDWLVNKGIEAACAGNGMLSVCYEGEV